jgi:hypothetical protein
MSRTIIYVLAGAALAALMLAALLSWRAANRQEARSRLVAAVCADPDQALIRAATYAQLSNGAAGPGVRPLIADSRFVDAELKIINSYCPEKLPAFEQFLDELETSG